MTPDRRWLPPVDRQQGAGTALALAVIAAVVVLFGLFATLAVVLDAGHRAAAAADAAALAAADTALGAVDGIPCERAAQVAAAGDAVLVRCVQRGDLVRVRVTRSALGIAVAADAVAGPPPVVP